jgi:hypothetical protein
MTMGRLLATCCVSVALSCGIGYAWLRTHPSPRLVRVDVGSLFEEQKKLLAARLKPGMTEEEQKAIFLVAADYGKKVDAALYTVANECQCAVLNSAAIVRLPEGESSGIQDMTWRLLQLLGKPTENESQ